MSFLLDWNNIGLIDLIFNNRYVIYNAYGIKLLINNRERCAIDKNE